MTYEPPVCPDETQYDLTPEQAATCALIRRNVATIQRCVDEIQQAIEPMPWQIGYEFFDDLRDSAGEEFLAYALQLALADDVPCDHLDEFTHKDWQRDGEPEDLRQWLADREPPEERPELGRVVFVESDAIPDGWNLVTEGRVQIGDRYFLKVDDETFAWVPIYDGYDSVSVDVSRSFDCRPTFRCHRRLIRKAPVPVAARRSPSRRNPGASSVRATAANRSGRSSGASRSSKAVANA